LIRKLKIQLNAFLDRLRIVFWVVFGLLLALELATAIARGMAFAVGTFVMVSGIIYIVVVLATVAFFFTTGIRLMIMLSKTKKAMSSPEHRMQRVKRVRPESFPKKEILCN
jgi:hypothetical protein